MDAFNMYDGVDLFLSCDEETLRSRVIRLQKLASELYEKLNRMGEVEINTDGNVCWTYSNIPKAIDFLSTEVVK